MTNDNSEIMGDLNDKVERLTADLSQLRQAFDIHTTAETGHRALQLEKIENLKLVLENAAIKQASENAQRFEIRLATLEQKAQTHIDRCTEENEQLERAQRDRTNNARNLQAVVIGSVITQVLAFIFLYIRTAH